MRIYPLVHGIAQLNFNPIPIQFSKSLDLDEGSFLPSFIRRWLSKVLSMKIFEISEVIPTPFEPSDGDIIENENYELATN